MKVTTKGIMKPVKGKEGIMSGGASVPSTKPTQGKEGFGYAPASKTNMPCGGGKPTGGKL